MEKSENYKKYPLVSIGLPVFNGERYLREVIECFLSQTYNNLEIIISDNNSGDATSKISREYEKLDCRIKYIQNKKNYGAAPNFNQAFKNSKGKYFKWAAHDDLCDNKFIEKCVDVLEVKSDVVLVTSKIYLINEDNKVIKKYNDTDLLNISSKRVEERFLDLIKINHWCIDVFGLIRSEALKKTDLICKYVGSDRNLLVQLGLSGKFYRIQEYLFYSRDHKERSIRNIPELRNRQKWFSTDNNSKYIFPYCELLYNYLRDIYLIDMKFVERLKCFVNLVKYVKWNRNLFVDDLKAGFCEGWNSSNKNND